MNGLLINFLKILLLIIFGYLNWKLYKAFNFVPIDKNRTQKIQKNIEAPVKKQSVLIIGFLSIVLVISVLYIFPFGYQSEFYNFSYTIFLIMFTILILPLISLFILTLETKSSIKSSIKILSSKYIYYLLPIIISIISLFLSIFYFNQQIGQESNFTFLELINFQKNNVLIIYQVEIPAIFLIINPFSFLSYIFGIIGFLRESNLDLNSKISMFQNYEKLAKRRKLIDFINSMFLYLALLLIIPLFVGTFWFSDNQFVNLSLSLLLCVLFTIFISFYGKDKPESLVEKKIGNSQRVPLLISIISVFFSFIVLFLPIF